MASMAEHVPRTARERARAEVMSELLAAARARLVTDGSRPTCRLRAVARDLGMASSAVYRYVDSRDALLTLLIIEAYDAVGEVAEEAVGRAPAEPTRRRPGSRSRAPCAAGPSTSRTRSS